jgi:hypothetical protein
MAQAGLSIPAIIEAHGALCEERGDVVYTLKWLHEFIVRGEEPPTPKRRGRDPKNGCDCDLSVYDCLRLHQDDYPYDWHIVGKGAGDDEPSVRAAAR